MTWRTRRVREMARLFSGLPFPSTAFSPSESLPLVRIRDITASEFETYIPRELSPSGSLLRDGDVVIGMDGDFNVRLWDRGEAALNQRVCALRSRPSCDERFLAYSLPAHLKVINDLTYATTVKHLSSWQVEHITLGAPDLAEQRAIADHLDEQTSRIDTLIAKQTQLIDTLRERRSAVVVRGVTGWKPGTPAPASWFELAGTTFSTAPLRHMGSLATGTTPSGDHDELFGDEEGALGWVTPEDLTPDVRASRWLRDAGRSQVRPLAGGAVLICCIGATLGKVGYSARSVSTNQQITGITPRDDGRYLYYGLLAARGELERLAVGNTLPILNNQRLAGLVLPRPRLDEQQKIVAYLDEQTSKIDALIAKTQEHIALAKERRAALITAAVTGQIDVRTAGRAATVVE